MLPPGPRRGERVNVMRTKRVLVPARVSRNAQPLTNYRLRAAEREEPSILLKKPAYYFDLRSGKSILLIVILAIFG